MMKRVSRRPAKSFTWRAPLLAAMASLAVWASPAMAWEPTKPVEFVVPAGTGGGADQMARLIQGIIVKHKLMKESMVVINKSGGAGAEGLPVGLQDHDDRSVGGDGVGCFEDRDGRLGHESPLPAVRRKGWLSQARPIDPEGGDCQPESDGRTGNQPSPAAIWMPERNNRFLMAT